MTSDEALLQILTHVKTTACEIIEITSCEEAMRFLKAWGKASLTSLRHARGIKTLKDRFGPLQEAMAREAATEAAFQRVLDMDEEQLAEEVAALFQAEGYQQLSDLPPELTMRLLEVPHSSPATWRTFVAEHGERVWVQRPATPSTPRAVDQPPPETSTPRTGSSRDTQYLWMATFGPPETPERRSPASDRTIGSYS